MASTLGPKGNCILIACFFLVGAVIVIPVSLTTINSDRDLAARGRHVEAVVQYGTTRLSTGAGQNGNERTEYLLITHYGVKGREYGQTFSVDYPTFEAKNSYGRTLDVLYDPEDPNRAKLASDPSGQGWVGLVFGALFLIAALVLPIVGWRLKPATPTPDLDEALERARRGV